jgi:hypothetical protein
VIAFVPTSEPPEGEGKATAHLKDTVAMWRVRYGPLFETNNHIDLAIIGLVPLCYIGREAYIWLTPLCTDASRAALREAKRAFTAFEAALPWNTFICTEVGKSRNERFGRFMGYTPYATQNNITFSKRA